MPAGDLVVADYQLELGGVLMGATTKVIFEPPGITGLGIPAAKTQDVVLDGADGSYAPADYRSPRTMTFPFVILGTSAADAMGQLQAIRPAWDAAAADVPLYFQLPGLGKVHLNGRPRGMDTQLQDLKSGVIHVLCTFVANDPTINPG